MNANNNIGNSSKGNNPFKTGADYFEDFNSKLQGRIEGFDEIKTIAPVLSSIPKYNPFEVPESYFDELSALVQQRCTESKSSTSIVEWLTLIFKPRFAIPVLAVVLIAIAGINSLEKSISDEPVILSELSVEDELYNIDEATIIEKITADAGIAGTTDTDNDNGIEDYLIENNIDEINLNNEL